MYYPRVVNNNDQNNYNILFLRQMLADCDQLLNPNEVNESNLYDLEKQLLEMRLPNSWNVYDENNKEREMEVSFEKYLLMLSDFTNENVHEMSVFRFFALEELIKEKTRKK